ncbi:MAG: hypothetical protein IKA87_02765 [Lentisphaeria bacterium]|nr:hypothetical protein [Lentisphaeria bacterium]
MATNSYDINTIKRHSYVATFGTAVIAPLAEAPKIETDRKIVESTIYENGGHEAVASHLVRDCAVITLKTKDISTALELMSNFSLGDDIMSESKKQALTFTPLAEGEKTLIFPAAYLQPEASYVPSMGEDHVATLVFKAFADNESGKLFTFA